MLGTLNGALEARQVKLPNDAIGCTAEGVNEVHDGLPVLTAVRVHYRLRIPAGSRETVDRALANPKLDSHTNTGIDEVLGESTVEGLAQLKPGRGEGASSASAPSRSRRCTRSATRRPICCRTWPATGPR